MAIPAKGVAANTAIQIQRRAREDTVALSMVIKAKATGSLCSEMPKSSGHMPSPVCVVVVTNVIMVVVLEAHGDDVQSKRHGLNQGVQAEADKGDEPELMAVHVPVFHALAQVFQPDLNQETRNHPLSGHGIHGKSFGEQVQEAQSEQEGAAESEQQQGHVSL